MPSRLRAVTAVIFGFFAMIWFGWAQAQPPAWLQGFLIAGSILSVLVLIVGAVAAARLSGPLPVMNDPDVGRRYGIHVGIEMTAAALGAGLLGVAGAGDWAGVWVCAVVGAHFFPLASVLGDRSLIPLGVLVLGVAVAATVVGAFSATAPITVAATGAGVSVLAFAIGNLVCVRPRHGEQVERREPAPAPH